MATKEQELKQMFENYVHIGHQTRKWNPKVKPLLYGDKEGLHIINLENTYDKLQEALEFMSKVKSEGKTILFVSTKPQSVKLVEELANNLGMPYVTSKWIPGLITNFSTIKKRIKYLADLKDQRESGELEKYTKKERVKLEKTISKLELALGGVQNLKAIPDAVFVVDIVRDAIVVEEANKVGLPVVSFVDSNGDPSKVNYPIPANDDALKSLKYLFAKIEDTLKSSKSKK